MATWSNLSLQNAASPLMEQLSFFHDHTMMILIVITIMVSYIMTSLFTNKLINNTLENQNIEILWTILPAITLIFIALPSLRLLYLLDESFNPLMSIKTMGHQWYWSYEYMDFTNNMEFDSYLIPYNEMKSFNFRLLEVDNHTVLPMNVQIRLLISSTDVIHSWTIPSLGIKADANPGRLNQLNLLINRPGLFFGQCSEICGANHSFMPITIESVNLNSFIKWIKS